MSASGARYAAQLQPASGGGTAAEWPHAAASVAAVS